MFKLFIPQQKTAEARNCQRAAAADRLRRIAPGIYTDAPRTEIDTAVKQHWQAIVAHLLPGAVISHKTAFAGLHDNHIILSHPTIYNKSFRLGGMTIKTVRGPSVLALDMKMGGHDLYWSSRSRMLLENIGTASQLRAGTPAVETKLVELLHTSTEAALRRILDTAESLTALEDHAQAFAVLKQRIGVLLGTQTRQTLTQPALALLAKPLDSSRIYRFNKLADTLRSAVLPVIPDVAEAGAARQHFAVLESYFSNYVEGTHFSIKEAIDIALYQNIQTKRPADSHDIASVYRYILSREYRATLPAPANFLTELQERHAFILQKRPEAEPGVIKTISNYAGTTEFVKPDQVEGTLLAGAELALTVPEGLPRAIFYAFLITEVHPFVDGNGRLSRLLMNAELSRVGQCRIIMPTLFHSQYVDCQRVLSRQNHPDGFVNAIRNIAGWCSQFDYSDLAAVVNEMTRCNAFEDSLVLYKLLTRSALTFADYNDPFAL